MGYLDNNLMAGEQIIHRAKIHWATLFIRPVVWLVLGIFFISQKEIQILGSLFIIASILDCLGALLVFATSEFGITNKRVIMKTGLIRRKTLEMLLNKVETVGVDQGIMGRIFGYGTITVKGTGGSASPFNKIAQPMVFRTRAHEQIEALAAGKA